MRRSAQVHSVMIMALWALRRVVRSEKVADNWVCASAAGLMIAGMSDSILLLLLALINAALAIKHSKNIDKNNK